MRRSITKQVVALVLVVFLAAYFAVAADTQVSDCLEPTPIRASFLQGSEDYLEHPPVVILDSDDFITSDFEGTGSPEDPFVIEGLNITTTTRCVYLKDISDYVVIRDCFFKTSSDYFPCALFDNTNHTTIRNCIFQGGLMGIQVIDSALTTIDDCVLFEAETGIWADSSFMLNCSDSRILSNEIGISIAWSDMCNLTRNKIYRNSESGIRLGLNSTRTLVIENMIGKNRVPGIETNAEDFGEENNWTGNYWSDYTSPGPYVISGGAESSDDSPGELQDNQSPELETHEDLFYAEGTTGYEIQWNATDEFPWTYTITKDAQVMKEETWISQIISFPVDGLPPGNHLFRIRLLDIDENEVQDDVEVFVFIIIFSNIGTAELLIGSASSVALVLGVIVLFKSHQRRASPP